MKKKNVLNLIKYHTENNDSAFRAEACEIARYFDATENYQLAEYIMSLLSDANAFLPQVASASSTFLTKTETSSESLPLPKKIEEDILGIINTISKNIGIHKFLFEGAPGTGKTETAKHIARILDRELFMVDFEAIIDSKLGQTSKNISELFNEINQLSYPNRIMIFFDEIDALAMNRMNHNDLREMGRVTSTLLKELDSLSEKIVLIATTNLFQSFDKALTRRFDFVINFNRYSQEDLTDVAESILNNFLNKYKIKARNIRLFRKILGLMDEIPYPGELKNIIKMAIAFSDFNKELDYLKKLLEAVKQNHISTDFKELQSYGFTLREIEILTGVSKSKLSRELKGVENE